MKPTVYVETSVISYLTAQVSRDLVVAAHQQVTAEWWEQALPKFEPFISPVVLEEIGRGDPDTVKRRIKAVGGFRVLDVAPDVRDLAEHYFAAIDLPEKARADAYHLALAVWHGMDYLVTWNCTHLAGGKVKLIVEGINAGRGIGSPIICTPEELMEVGRYGKRSDCSAGACHPQGDRAAVPGRRFILPASGAGPEDIPQAARAAPAQEGSPRPSLLSRRPPLVPRPLSRFLDGQVPTVQRVNSRRYCASDGQSKSPVKEGQR